MANSFLSFYRVLSIGLAAVAMSTLVIAVPVSAKTENPNAYHVVESATVDIMKVVEMAPTYVDQDPERY